MLILYFAFFAVLLAWCIFIYRVVLHPGSEIQYDYDSMQSLDDMEQFAISQQERFKDDPQMLKVYQRHHQEINNIKKKRSEK